MNADIVLLPGDGVGPEVVHAGRRALEHVARKFGHTFVFEEHPIGGAAIEAHGVALTDEVLAACRSAHAALLGAVGGPKWDDPAAAVRPEQGLLGLRQGLGLFANLRPVRPHPALFGASPLKPERLAGVDLLLVRELTGGLYFGQPRGREERPDGHLRAVDTLEYYDYEIRRVVELACRLALGRRRKVTSVDKANVLEASRLWRQVAAAVGAQHEGIALEHMLVDTASLRLLTAPASFDVVVTENMFGDILSDEAAALVGSIGMLPSASLGADGPGVFEPVHGSAPDIAGKGVANPLGAILSCALLLRHSLQLEAEAAALEAAVDRTITDGCRTADLSPDGGAYLTTRQMTDEVIARL